MTYTKTTTTTTQPTKDEKQYWNKNEVAQPQRIPKCNLWFIHIYTGCKINKITIYHKKNCIKNLPYFVILKQIIIH